MVFRDTADWMQRRSTKLAALVGLVSVILRSDDSAEFPEITNAGDVASPEGAGAVNLQPAPSNGGPGEKVVIYTEWTSLIPTIASVRVYFGLAWLTVTGAM
jgi:hypothetical protein